MSQQNETHYFQPKLSAHRGVMRWPKTICQGNLPSLKRNGSGVDQENWEAVVFLGNW